MLEAPTTTAINTTLDESTTATEAADPEIEMSEVTYSFEQSEA